MDCSLPGSSAHGIFQARILERLPWPPPGDLPDSGIQPTSFMSPALQADSLLLSHQGRPQRIPRRDKKAFLSDQCKEIEENNRIERPEISSTKLKTPREHFIEKTGTIKDRNTKDLTTVEEIKKRWRENTEELYKKRS